MAMVVPPHSSPVGQHTGTPGWATYCPHTVHNLHIILVIGTFDVSPEKLTVALWPSINTLAPASTGCGFGSPPPQLSSLSDFSSTPHLYPLSRARAHTHKAQ